MANASPSHVSDNDQSASPLPMTALKPLRQRYQETIQAKLRKDLGLANVHEIPKVMKVTINRGLGEAAQNAKALEAAVQELAIISGQRPVITRAKKAIASFKIRAGMPIGAMVTLRGQRMYAFLDRLLNLALPRIRDFRGVSPKSFDGRGNYTLGVKEQLIFPEITFDQIDAVRGMDITIVTSARNDDEGRALLTELGMPFRRN